MTVDRRDDLHRRRWPWCPWGGRWHTHTEQLNGPSLVNGRPAGPTLLLAGRDVRPASPVLATAAVTGWAGAERHPQDAVAAYLAERQSWREEARTRFDWAGQLIRDAVLADLAAGRDRSLLGSYWQ